MNEALRSMLAPYQCRSGSDYENALREILQEIALLGLWRAKFFEHAAFYGGSALRIVYDLDRFSEDLDFSLLKPQPGFSLERYLPAIEAELRSFGFATTTKPMAKTGTSSNQSAFVKANTRQSLLVIEVPPGLVERTHREAALKIKIEVDIEPPPGFQTEAKIRMLPIPFSILTYQQPDLFAGKMHALIHRHRTHAIKGRDWYDLVWCVARAVPVRLSHLLQARLVQTGAWTSGRPLTRPDMLALLDQRIEALDIEAARADVIRFVRDPDSVALWTKPFFREVAGKITVA